MKLEEFTNLILNSDPEIAKLAQRHTAEYGAELHYVLFGAISNYWELKFMSDNEFALSHDVNQAIQLGVEGGGPPSDLILSSIFENIAPNKNVSERIRMGLTGRSAIILRDMIDNYHNGGGDDL